jgi:large subunit ribosomal protein L28
MARQCEICGKGPSTGNTISRRGKAKYLGGVGRKVTGISRRQFKPNLQKLKVVLNGTVQRIKVCTQCLRSGKVQRPVKRKPFQMPTS